MLKTKDIEAVFPSPLDQNSIAYWIPISMLEKVCEAYKSEGKAVRIRWRGSRTEQVGISMPNGRGGFYSRSRSQAHQDCLKEFATHFCVYTK
jgi:hypothetical protein